MSHVSRRRVRCTVLGVVQGVFFRAQTQREAAALGLSGWVRNLPDGRVEYVAEGTTPDVDALILWSEVGPPAARVDRVDVLDEGLKGHMGPFEVRPTPFSS